jgi:hypothetical protein
MKTDPVVIPAMVLNTPTDASIGDNADTYSFMNHKTGAGQRNLIKSRMLITAAKQLNTIANICMINSILSNRFFLNVFKQKSIYRGFAGCISWQPLFT